MFHVQLEVSENLETCVKQVYPFKPFKPPSHLLT